jgi:hypothetical protein
MQQVRVLVTVRDSENTIRVSKHVDCNVARLTESAAEITKHIETIFHKVLTRDKVRR